MGRGGSALLVSCMHYVRRVFSRLASSRSRSHFVLPTFPLPCHLLAVPSLFGLSVGCALRVLSDLSFFFSGGCGGEAESPSASAGVAVDDEKGDNVPVDKERPLGDKEGPQPFVCFSCACLSLSEQNQAFLPQPEGGSGRGDGGEASMPACRRFLFAFPSPPLPIVGRPRYGECFMELGRLAGAGKRGSTPTNDDEKRGQKTPTNLPVICA